MRKRTALKRLINNFKVARYYAQVLEDDALVDSIEHTIDSIRENYSLDELNEKEEVK